MGNKTTIDEYLNYRISKGDKCRIKLVMLTWTNIFTIRIHDEYKMSNIFLAELNSCKEENFEESDEISTEIHPREIEYYFYTDIHALILLCMYRHFIYRERKDSIRCYTRQIFVHTRQVKLMFFSASYIDRLGYLFSFLFGK